MVRVANAAPVLDLDVRLRARRASSPSFVDVIDIRDFCTNMPRYTFWRHNDWIAPERGPAVFDARSLRTFDVKMMVSRGVAWLR